MGGRGARFGFLNVHKVTAPGVGLQTDNRDIIQRMNRP
jgi:hypothetical protein